MWVLSIRSVSAQSKEVCWGKNYKKYFSASFLSIHRIVFSIGKAGSMSLKDRRWQIHSLLRHREYLGWKGCFGNWKQNVCFLLIFLFKTQLFCIFV